MTNLSRGAQHLADPTMTEGEHDHSAAPYFLSAPEDDFGHVFETKTRGRERPFPSTLLTLCSSPCRGR
ncbi:hypothetical protein IE81DRAFT_193240 [Ceraceosorus guamensis]|uniref:Uncharacterized protein n=1 Tax=Ceraceosorus guamensis TaxID=1522189 RepID=A0A316WDD8_9BASI|nr:hypothetical protein IE81DRAFT_193240 [Ceraceosorus guamensis]PWN45505.1 hypothetical protein IE81DRAFT_193240 [Ceraceosorus guamensis]